MSIPDLVGDLLLRHTELAVTIIVDAAACVVGDHTLKKRRYQKLPHSCFHRRP